MYQNEIKENTEVHAAANEDQSPRKIVSMYGPPPTAIPVATPKAKLERLDHLLTRTGFYVKFLSEKMEAHRLRMSQESTRVDDDKTIRRRGRKSALSSPSDGSAASETAPPSTATDGTTHFQQTQRELDDIFPLLKLRDYQKEGVAWLIGLYENGLNGILADEMGLGKTVQCIGLLAYLRRKGVHCPYLITAPVSTLSNWVDEFRRFAPDIPVLLYHGSIDEREQLRRSHMKSLDASFPVIVTSYDLVMNDIKYLDRYPWKFVIVDEGHRIKNLNCKLLRDLKSLRSMHRILLSGTPLHNNLSELWSMLNFLMPAIFDDLETFENWFNFSDIGERAGVERILTEENRSQIVSKLHQLLKPFLLRRLKSDVEQELPRKKEYLVYAPLTALQREFYEAILQGQLRDCLVQRAARHGPPAVPLQQQPAKKTRTTLAARSAAEWALRQPHIKPSEEEERDEEEEEEERSEQPKKRKNGFHNGFHNKNVDGLTDDSVSDSVDGNDTLDAAVHAAVQRSVQQMPLQNMMVQLRKACNHPYLFEYPLTTDGDFLITEALIQSAGKMRLIDQLIPALISRGHKILVFSQMTKMLDLLQDYCYLRQYPFSRIDGSVDATDRQTQIAAFNSDPTVPLFLLSTRAGGLGINLTSADTVIIFDSDWNPQADLQAQDRCHRIGQRKPVLVYRLVTAQTVESRLLERAAAKRKLEKLVIRQGVFRTFEKEQTRVTREEELRELLLAEDAVRCLRSDAADSAVLSTEALEALLDRSEAAFARATEGDQFRTLERPLDDMLADLDQVRNKEVNG